MDTIRAYFAMNGYAAFIWPAFALSVLVLGALAIASRKALKDSERALDAALAGRPAREDRPA